MGSGHGAELGCANDLRCVWERKPLEWPTKLQVSALQIMEALNFVDFETEQHAPGYLALQTELPGGKPDASAATSASINAVFPDFVSGTNAGFVVRLPRWSSR